MKGLIFSILLLTGTILFYGNTELKRVEEYTILVDAYKTLLVNLEKLRFRFPKIVLAQIMHETDRLRSPIYLQCNNCFGMKHNNRGLSKGECRGHAWYGSIKDSLKDYLLYQQIYLPFYEHYRYFRSVTTEEEYLQFLEWIKYAEDPDYAEKIKVWVNRIEETEILIRKQQ